MFERLLPIPVALWREQHKVVENHTPGFEYSATDVNFLPENSVPNQLTHSSIASKNCIQLLLD